MVTTEPSASRRSRAARIFSVHSSASSASRGVSNASRRAAASGRSEKPRRRNVDRIAARPDDMTYPEEQGREEGSVGVVSEGAP